MFLIFLSCFYLKKIGDHMRKCTILLWLVNYFTQFFEHEIKILDVNHEKYICRRQLTLRRSFISLALYYLRERELSKRLGKGLGSNLVI